MAPFRIVALALVAIVLVTAATPARAEAMEPTTMLLIAATGVGIIILVVYLVVANVSDRKHVDGPAPGIPIGGTPVGGVPMEGTPVAVTSYVVTPAATAPAVVAPAVEGL